MGAFGELTPTKAQIGSKELSPSKERKMTEEEVQELKFEQKGKEIEEKERNLEVGDNVFWKSDGMLGFNLEDLMEDME